MKKLFSTVPYLLIAILVGVTVAYAGNLTPPGSPAKTMKSLSDLYQLINTGANTPSTDFTTPGTISSTMNSLGDTYDLMKTKIAAIDASKILTGTTIFGKPGSASPGSGYTYGDTDASKVLTTATGVGTYNASNLTDSLVKLGTTFGVSSTGALVPSGGTATTSGVCNGLTFFGNNQTDWNLQTGGLNPSAGTILSGTTICGVPGTAVTNLAYGDASDPTKVLNTATNPGTFDPTTVSTYDVLNLSVGTVKSGTTFGDSLSLTGAYPSVTYPLPGDTGAGDAIDSSILSGLEAWTKAGVLITGTMPTRTLSPNNDTVSAGYYDATTLSAVDTDLISDNILSGKTIFGVAGNASLGYTYGDTIQSTVLTTAVSAGTYNVSNLSNSVIKKDTTWGVSLGSTGALTPDGGTAGVADLFNGKTANLTADWTLDTGNLNLACNTATFNGTGNLVADAYDGGGSGSNRWCMTDSGNAVAGEILLDKIAWVNGVAITGTGIISLGDAADGNVLAGKYFSNATTANVLGTMVDRAATSYTPSAVAQTILAGYYNGSGTVATDANLLTGNIKSGVTIFGVAGKTEVVDTTEATVPITADTVSVGKKGFVNGSLVTGIGIISLGDAIDGNVLAGKYFSNATTANVLGTMTDNTGLNVASTAQSQAGGVNYLTATQGYYDGTAKVSATDAQVVALNASLVTGNIKSGVTIFGVPGSLSAGNNYGIPKTSQQPSYPAGTPFQTGDDAYYANPGGGAGTDVGYPKGKVNWAGYNTAGGRFTDNTDGTVTDNATGLMWIKDHNAVGAPFDNTMTWSNAITNCESLSYAGQTDWRLPNRLELSSILNLGNSNPAINATYFPSTHSSNYWSSTTLAANTTYAWYVYFTDGNVNYNPKTDTNYVRCVR